MKPVTIDTTGMIEDDRAKIRADAVYSGYEVIDDPTEGIMVVRESKPTIRSEPKRRFFE